MYGFIKNLPAAALHEHCGAAWVRKLVSVPTPQQLSPQDSWCVLQLLPATVNLPTSERHYKKQPTTGEREREREYAYFVSVWPEIAQAVHPTPACCGDWCRGSDVECVVRWRGPDSAACLPATRHQSHLISAVQPAAGLVSTGHKIELLVSMCIFSMFNR